VVGAAGPHGRRAWAERKDLASVTAPTRLSVEFSPEKVRRCELEICEGIVDIWWASDGKSVYYSRREGWSNTRTGLYRWNRAEHRPRLITSSDDVLAGCQTAAGTLVCLHEGSIQPRRLVRIDAKSGQLRALFDPNPELTGVRLGSVERLRWTNDFGIEAHGDLVLPPDHRPGQTHPLILVGYRSRGFLRGGTGDDFPIQVYAAHGYAVLSADRPMSYGEFTKARTWEEVNRRDRVDWADFRSVQLSLEAGVRLAIAHGSVDAEHIGLTGLSNGASTAQFILVNSEMIGAAVLSTCCEEDSAVNLMGGPSAAKWLQGIGYPSLMDDGDRFWSPMSLRMNAARVRAPLLLQVVDREYLMALEGYTALKERGKPVEMYVFPDEYHLKWQPAHRLASYRRSLAWFDFWLRGIESTDADRADQYRRWRKMRAGRAALRAEHSPR
jgi:dipeptidyl aminopeptidase/acylaminoacyl peptidase